MKKISYIISVMILVWGCANEIREIKKENPLFSEEGNVSMQKATGIIDSESIGIFNPTKVIRKDSLLIVLNQNGVNKLSIYKLDGTKLFSFLPTGTGTAEGLYFLTMNMAPDGILTAYDFGNDKLVELDINQLNEPGFGPTFTLLSPTPKHLSVAKKGSLMLSTGIFLEGRYCLTLDNHSGYFLSYPETPGKENMSDSLKSMLYASNVTKLKPDGSRFVCANMQSGIIDIGAIHDNSTITRISEQNLYAPKASTSLAKTKPVVYSIDNLFGFCDIEVSDDYIYALYSGRSYRNFKNLVGYGEKIIVFDWEGNHVKTYQLSVPFTSISYNKEEHAIYGLTNTPQSLLVKYALE